MSYENADFQQGSESLGGDLMVGTVVSIDFKESQKFGEARVRVDMIHGDASDTPDEHLPIAMFFNKSYPESFGAFDVGDSVLLSYANGSRTAPMIEGKLFDLDSVLEVIPEYGENYGKVKGMYSKVIGATLFFNEANGSVVIRFKDGATFTLTKDKITSSAKDIEIIAENGANVKAKQVKVEGDTVDVVATSQVSIKAPIIREN